MSLAMDKTQKSPTQKSVRRRNFKKQRHGGRPDKPQINQQRVSQKLGFFGEVPSAPSLQDLQLENRKKTRRYFKNPAQQQWRSRYGLQPTKASRRQYHPTGPTPRPPAPVPTTRFLGAGNPLITPTLTAQAAEDPDGAGDKLEAEGFTGLDFYGTNEGMDFLNDLTDSSEEDMGSDSSDDEMGGDSIHTFHGGAVEEGALPGAVRHRLAEQEAYIAELEDENLKLRERLDLVRQEVMRLKAGSAGGDAGDDEPHLEVSTA